MRRRFLRRVSTGAAANRGAAWPGLPPGAARGALARLGPRRLEPGYGHTQARIRTHRHAHTDTQRSTHLARLLAHLRMDAHMRAPPITDAY